MKPSLHVLVINKGTKKKMNDNVNDFLKVTSIPISEKN